MKEEEKEKLLNEILYKLHKTTLAVPILKEYEIQEDSKGAIFIAKSKDNSVIQFLEDGKLTDNENFEERLNKVLVETEKSITDFGFRATQLKFIEDYKSDLFNFKLYLQDNVVGNTLIRQINAYFIEPENKYFYEIILAAPPINKSDENENITKNILHRLKVILKDVKYNEENPFKKNTE